MNGLIDAIDPRLTIRNATETGAGEQTKATWDHARFVADDVSEKIAGDKGIRTKDIGGTAKTSEVGDAVATELESLLKK